MLEGILILIGAAAFLFILVAVWDCNRFVTVEYEIVSEKIAKPCKFVLLSDLQIGRASCRERVLDRV